MAYSPDVTRLPDYRVKSMVISIPGYDSPVTLHEITGDMSLNPLTIVLWAEKRQADERIRVEDRFFDNFKSTAKADNPLYKGTK